MPMSPRRCIKCGNVGRVPMASTDGLCVECINERYMSAKRLELRRRGLAAVRLQRRIRGARCGGQLRGAVEGSTRFTKVGAPDDVLPAARRGALARVQRVVCSS